MLVMDGKESLLKSDDEDELIFDHTSLLNKEISFRDLSKKLYANGCKLQIARTINLCFSFFGLGLCFAIPTATLEDLKRSTGAGLDIRHIYTARYSGYLFGSILGGFLFDRYNRQFLLFLSLLATSIGVIVMPFCSNVGSLMACTAITGITMGFLDTGGNVWCLDLWGRKSAPIMQTLHFCFGLGAFVAPLVAEPFLSPLYLDSSVGIEGNSTVGNATHRFSHINFLHSGAPIKNLVPRGVDNSNISLEMLGDYEMSKFPHFMFKRNATDNSSEVVTFDNDSSTAQQNVTTENVDDLLNATSSTTVTSARTFKPKPEYADGNQLKTKDKWDRTPIQPQSTSVLQNSTTTVTTSTLPLTTQKQAELVTSRNDSEQNNSLTEQLMPDDKENATFDNGNQTASPVLDNTTTIFENVTLVKLPPSTTVITMPTTKGTSPTVIREVSSTLPSRSPLEIVSSQIQSQDGIPTSSKGPSSSTVNVTPVFITTSPISLPANVTSLITGTVPKTNKEASLTETPAFLSTRPTGLQNVSILLGGPIMKEGATTEAQDQSKETSGNGNENAHSTITAIPNLSNGSSTTTVVNQPFSVLVSLNSSSITSTVEYPNNESEGFNTNETGSVSNTIHDPTDKSVPVTPSDMPTPTTDMNATDGQLLVNGAEKEGTPSAEFSSSHDFEKGEVDLSSSTKFQNTQGTTSLSSSVNGMSPIPLLANETHEKPTTQRQNFPSKTGPVETDTSTQPYHAKEQSSEPVADFEPNKNRLATSYKISTPASKMTTLKTTTVIDSSLNPPSTSDPQQSVSVVVDQPELSTPSGTLAENEVSPAEVDRDVDRDTEKHHRKVGINRVKNSNVLTAQDTDNYTESVSDDRKKGRHLDTLTDIFDALRKNRLGKFEIAYVILGLYVFVVAVVFLVFLCKNPREPRSRQLEELSKTRDASRCFTYSMVCLLSLFLCLYVGIEVAVGEVLQTFASMETLRLSTASGYFLSYLFWGGFAISRFVTIIISMKFSGFCILLTNLTICLVASIMLVAGADKIEALLWLGTVILGLGVGPLFPTAIAWVERYVHVTNKTASVFILGAALGEIVIPIIINAFINQEPMVLMYVNIIVNALCFISFIILSVLAFRHGEKYLKKPKRSLYRLANMDDTEDGTELITNSFSNSNGTDTGVKQRYRKLCT